MMATGAAGRVALLGALASFGACHRQIDERNLLQLRPNISQKEVETILGHPNRTEKMELELETQKKTMAITRYYYDRNGETIVLHFQNGLLVNEPERLNQR
ncbi:MAG TPA: hypothetical protein VGD78_00340 [Chthoniobacterales bacterium]